MLATLQTLLGFLLIGAGAYAALSGTVAAAIGVGDALPVRIARPAGAAIALIGLALYFAGSICIADLMRAPL